MPDNPPTATGTMPEQSIGARELLVMISAVMAVMALGIDTLLPAFDDIRAEYDLGEGSNQVGQLITVFFAGLAIAQLVYGPLADRFGRKPILVFGLGLSVVGVVGSVLAPSFEMLLLARLVWGVGAAGARVVATAIIRDRFEGPLMAKAMSQIMAVFLLVPVIAPALGAGLIAVFPWESVFWFCAVWAVAIGLWSTRLNETLRPEHVRALSVRDSLSAYREVVRTPVTFGYTASSLFIQGVMTSYLAVSELLISDIFGRGAQFPFIFGATAAVFGVAAVTNGRLVMRFGVERMLTLAFGLLVPWSVVLLGVALLTDGQPSFWLFFPMLALALGSFMLIMPNLNAVAMTPVGHVAGSAAAFTGAFRMLGGAAIGAIVTTLVSDSVTPFAIAVTVLCSAAALSVVVTRRRGHGA